jgi:glycosyltransferase involved in cell wall biosynthesis
MTAHFPTIGFDARLWHRTGIGRYIRNIAARLHGADLVVWAQPSEMDVVRAELPTACVRPCPAKPYSIREMLFWRRELRRVPLDLFHAPHINIPVGVSVPIVVTMHDLIPLRYRGTINSWLGERYFGLMSSWAVSAAARVIAVSETTRRDLVNLLGANPAKIRTVGEGADPRFGIRAAPERLQALRVRFGLAPRYLLYAGQWKPHKNLGTLLTAFAEIHRRHPDVQLVLVGREDPNQPHVPELIGRLGLDAAVIRTGYLRDEQELVGLFQGASVVAHPSRYEGFGLPPLEAMAAGVPVVASNAASLPEVVGNAGVLVPPDDVGQWVTALERAMLDPSLRDDLIRAGQERVRKMTWDRAAAETLVIYHEVLRETVPGRASAAMAPTWHLWSDVRSPRSSFGTGS